MDDTSNISNREIEILSLLASGASNKQIAHELVISVNTVKVHLRNIYSKLDVSTRTEAVLGAIEQGIINPLPDSISVNDRTQLADPDITGKLSGDGGYKPAIRRNIISLILIAVLVSISGVVLFNNLRGRTGTANGGPVAETIGDRWNITGTSLEPIQDFAIAQLNDDIYVIGGETALGVVDTTAAFDPDTNHWKELASKPTAVKSAYGAVIGGKIYIPGGENQDNIPLDVFEVYDPQSDTWEILDNLPQAISRYSMVAYEGRLFVLGGWDGKDYLASVFEYNPHSGVWLGHPPMPTARGYSGAEKSGSFIYVVGGFDGEEALDVNERFAPDANSSIIDPWTIMSPLPFGRYGHAIAAVADIFHIVGGINEEGQALPPVKYFASNDEWHPFETPHNYPWSLLGLVPVGSKLYAFGGRVNDALSDHVFSYQAIYTVHVPVLK